MNPAKISSLTIGYLMLLWSVTAAAQGTFIYDQQSSTESVVYEGSLSVTSGQPMGQSFTPSLSAVGFIRLDLSTGPIQSGASVAILLHSGSITGPTIGTSAAVSLPTNFNGFVSFIYETPSSVTPGTQYYFQPVVQSGADYVDANYSDGYGYPGGAAIFQGTTGGLADLWFREGIVVPEPSTWALLILGAGALWFLRRKS